MYAIYKQRENTKLCMRERVRESKGEQLLN